HIDEAPPGQKLIETVYKGASEVSSAILTAVSTTIVSFIPGFTMQAAEGKLLGPLAFTKTVALVAGLSVALFTFPAFSHRRFGARIKNKTVEKWVNASLTGIGIIALIAGYYWGGALLFLFGISGLLKTFFYRKEQNYPGGIKWLLNHSGLVIAGLGVI